MLRWRVENSIWFHFASSKILEPEGNRDGAEARFRIGDETQRQLYLGTLPRISAFCAWHAVRTFRRQGPWYHLAKPHSLRSDGIISFCLHQVKPHHGCSTGLQHRSALGLAGGVHSLSLLFFSSATIPTPPPPSQPSQPWPSELNFKSESHFINRKGWAAEEGSLATVQEQEKLARLLVALILGHFVLYTLSHSSS